MRLVRTILLAAWAFALAGCASYGTIEQARTSTGSSCCSSLRDLPYKSLSPNQRHQFDLDLEAPSFTFAQGISRFAAIRLPTTTPVDLWLKTFWIGNLGPDSFVFRPTLTFLDQDFSVINTVTPKLTWARSFMAAHENLGWEGQVPIPPASVFVIIHTDRSQLGSRLYIKEAVTHPGFEAEAIATQKGPIITKAGWWDVYLPTAESGRIALEVVLRK